MEDKKIIKNMEYWKKKNNIPGIKALESAGLTDGRAGSAPFQMESPNKSFWKALNPLTGGPIGALARGMMPNNRVIQAVTDPFGIGGATGGMGSMNRMSAANTAQQVPAYNPVQQPVQVPVQGSAVAMKKSPMEQEEMMMEEKPVDPTEKIYIEGDYKEGDLVTEDDLESQFKRTGNDPKDYPQLSVQDYSEIRVDEKGMYVQKLKEKEEIKGLEMGGVGEIKPGI